MNIFEYIALMFEQKIVSLTHTILNTKMAPVTMTSNC